MATGFLVDCFFYEVGHPDFLHSFFSTISYHLEPDGWGTRFPNLLEKLYSGKLEWAYAESTIEEIKKVAEEFKQMSPDQSIWDIGNLESKAPWSDEIPNFISNLDSYFANTEGKTFSEVLLKALAVSAEDCEDIVIKTIL